MPASAAGALLGAWINYTLNYHFTFRSSKRHREAVLKFAAVATVGLVLNTLFMWVGVELIGAHYLLGQIVTTGLVLIWSFAGNRFWTFQSSDAARIAYPAGASRARVLPASGRRHFACACQRGDASASVTLL